MPTRKPDPEAPKPGDKLPAAPVRNRGHYTTPYGRFRSVTTILEGGWPKPALIGWSGRVAAQAAVDQIPWLSTLRGQDARDDAVKWLKNEHNRLKDAAAEHGNICHRYLEARLLGAPTPQPTSDILAACYAAIDHFLDTMTPDLEASELVVANPEQGYAGTGDGWLRFPRHLVTIGPGVSLLDCKSGRSTWGETSMQLGAYQRARICWLRDGREDITPEAARALVLHIRPPGSDGPDDPGAGPDGWTLQQANTSDATHDTFLHVKAVSEAYSRIDKKGLGAPLDPTPDLIDVVPPAAAAGF